MCRCTPEIRTPWCGKPGCEAPKQKCPHCHDGCKECQPARKDLEQYKPAAPVTARPGTELVAYSPEPVVGLLEFQGCVIVATSGGVWRMVKDADGKDHFEPIPFKPERLGIE